MKVGVRYADIKQIYDCGSCSCKSCCHKTLVTAVKKAGLINVKRGSGGADIEKPLEEIKLLNVYNAVECVEEGKLFHFHENPNQLCPVGKISMHF